MRTIKNLCFMIIMLLGMLGYAGPIGNVACCATENIKLPNMKQDIKSFPVITNKSRKLPNFFMFPDLEFTGWNSLFEKKEKINTEPKTKTLQRKRGFGLR